MCVFEELSVKELFQSAVALVVWKKGGQNLKGLLFGRHLEHKSVFVRANLLAWFPKAICPMKKFSSTPGDWSRFNPLLLPRALSQTRSVFREKEPEKHF